jgi:ABC-2 type transport system permease protein
MKKYIQFIKISFNNGLAYRVEYFVGTFRNLVILLVQLCVWRALLAAGSVTTDAGVITLREMTTYVVLSSMIGTLLTVDVIWSMNDRIRNGQIAMDLVKPVNYQTYTFCSMLGQNMFSFLFQLLPILVIGVFSVGIDFPSIFNFLLFLVTLINAIVIMFQMNYALGLVAFWYMRGWQSTIVWILNRLFSGRYIPLWFFPPILVTISYFLPLRLMYFVTISIYLGTMAPLDCLYAILQQFAWMVLLYGLTRLMWRAAIKKLVIQGG